VRFKLKEKNTHAPAKPVTVLGRNIRQCLDYVPWTVEQLAYACRVSKRTISRWSANPKHNAKLSYINEVAKALQIATNKKITHRDLVDSQFEIYSAPDIKVDQ